MDAHVGKYVTCMACDVATSAPAAASALIIVKQQQQQDEENTQAEKQSRAEQSRPEQNRTDRVEQERRSNPCSPLACNNNDRWVEVNIKYGKQKASLYAH